MHYTYIIYYISVYTYMVFNNNIILCTYIALSIYRAQSALQKLALSPICRSETEAQRD